MHVNIRDIAYTLQERREHFNYRSAYSATGIDDLIGKVSQDTSYAQINSEGRNRIVFMFPGQGAQYTHMAKALYENEPFFRNIINQLHYRCQSTFSCGSF